MTCEMQNFSSVLIANRGEIACRIIKTAKKYNIKTIAVYTLADKESLHVRLADTAVLIGDGPIAESYLSIQKIITAAILSKAHSIHPGYGFLSENADFAIACEKNKIIFIGPKPDAIKIMGNKSEAKKLMSAAGVPCIPGTDLNSNVTKDLSKIISDLGFPVMIKAASGGGGKGMRLVSQKKDLQNAVNLAKAEALNAFGSEQVIVEKAIIEARHVEIQIFGDKHGNLIHLGERDCSVQRRHQKVVEESPSPALSPKLRQAMGELAIIAAKEIEYYGAGTVEFLLDKNGDFYFLEMNTRIQVEHPVTELVTGLDLVYLQFLVADNKPLPIIQSQLNLIGHAIEIRLYAEDPAKDFLPSSGVLQVWNIPEKKDVRVDSGVKEGNIITPFYDPMLAKLVSFAPTRREALLKLIDALENTSIFGVKNNRNFLIDLLKQKKFSDGLATTAFLEETYSHGFTDPNASSIEFVLTATLMYREKLHHHLIGSKNVKNELIGWSNRGMLASTLTIKHLNHVKMITILCQGENKFLARLEDMEFEIGVDEDVIRINGLVFNLISFNKNINTYQLITPGADFYFEEVFPSDIKTASKKTGSMLAPMHGLIVDVFANVGTTVKAGDRLLVLEAMKMQHEILAPFDGLIIEVLCKKGNQVSIEDTLIEIQSRDPEA